MSIQQQNSVDVLMHRVAELPVPAAVISQATHLYNATKESNRLFNYTFGLAEGALLYAAQRTILPARQVLDKPLDSVGAFAVKQLDNVEKSYPIVKKTPEELWEDYKRLSETNQLVKTIDLARVAAIYGLDKAQVTTKFAVDAVSDAKKRGVDTAATTVRTGLRAVNGVFDISEHLIDKYIVPAGSQTSEAGEIDYGKDDDLTVVGRVSQISTKFSNGLKARAGHAKTCAQESIQQLQQAVFLLEHVKQISEWAKENQQLSNAQQQAVALWNGIKVHAEQVKQNPESVVVDVVKRLASGSDFAFDQVLNLTSAYLPSTLLAPAASTSEFLHQLNDNFAKATQLSEIKNEIVVNAREQLVGIEDLLMRVVDFVSNLPAAKWVVKIGEHHLLPMTGSPATASS